MTPLARRRLSRSSVLVAKLKMETNKETKDNSSPSVNRDKGRVMGLWGNLSLQL